MLLRQFEDLVMNIKCLEQNS